MAKACVGCISNSLCKAHLSAVSSIGPAYPITGTSVECLLRARDECLQQTKSVDPYVIAFKTSYLENFDALATLLQQSANPALFSAWKASSEKARNTEGWFSKDKKIYLVLLANCAVISLDRTAISSQLSNWRHACFPELDSRSFNINLLFYGSIGAVLRIIDQNTTKWAVDWLQQLDETSDAYMRKAINPTIESMKAEFTQVNPNEEAKDVIDKMLAKMSPVSGDALRRLSFGVNLWMLLVPSSPVKNLWDKLMADVKVFLGPQLLDFCQSNKRDHLPKSSDLDCAYFLWTMVTRHAASDDNVFLPRNTWQTTWDNLLAGTPTALVQSRATNLSLMSTEKGDEYDPVDGESQKLASEKKHERDAVGPVITRLADWDEQKIHQDTRIEQIRSTAKEAMKLIDQESPTKRGVWSYISSYFTGKGPDQNEQLKDIRERLEMIADPKSTPAELLASLVELGSLKSSINEKVEKFLLKIVPDERKRRNPELKKGCRGFVGWLVVRRNVHGNK